MEAIDKVLKLGNGVHRLHGHTFKGSVHLVANELLRRVLALDAKVRVVHDKQAERRTAKVKVYGKTYTVSLDVNTAKTDEQQPPQVASLSSEYKDEYKDLSFAEVVELF